MEKPLSITDLYSELSRIKNTSILTQKEIEALSIGWVKRYSRENNVSFDEACETLNEYINNNYGKG